MASLLRAVVRYVWIISEEPYEDVRLPKEEYWDGGTVEIDGKRFIAVADQYQNCRDPDEEVLSCGHRQPIKKWNGYKRFNARRVCKLCAAETFFQSI